MTERHNDTLDHLPPAFREIAEIVGLKAALAIAAEQAGMRIYVPKTPAKQHWLIKLIGSEATRQLSHRYGGTEIDVPLLFNGNRASIWQQVQRLLRDGRSVADIIRIAGISRRSVYRHKGRLDAPRKPSDQGELF